MVVALFASGLNKLKFTLKSKKYLLLIHHNDYFLGLKVTCFTQITDYQ